MSEHKNENDITKEKKEDTTSNTGVYIITFLFIASFVAIIYNAVTQNN